MGEHKIKDRVQAIANLIIDEVAAERGVTREELLKEAQDKLARMPDAHVAAIMAKPVITIHEDMGTVEVSRRGVFKGFGPDFRRAITGGNKQQTVKIGADIQTGQFPEGHPEAGKWAVQVRFQPFDSQETANIYADNLTPVIEQVMGTKALVRQ